MISRLVRTELESYLHDLVVWGGTVFLLLVLILSFLGTVVVQIGGPLIGRPARPVPAVGGSVLGAARGQGVLAKRRREEDPAFLATARVDAGSVVRELVRPLVVPPDTHPRVHVFLARAANMPFATFALITLATYLGGTTLVAAISVAMSIRPLAFPMPAWAKGVYIACAIVAVVIWIFLWNLLVLPSIPPAAIGRLADAGLPGLIGCLMVSSVGLLVLDVWLRDRADDYLG